MEFAITLSGGAVAIIGVSIVLFALVTALCIQQGLFGADDQYGIAFLFALCFYAALWAVPSLLIWAVWATWFRA